MALTLPQPRRRLTLRQLLPRTPTQPEATEVIVYGTVKRPEGKANLCHPDPRYPWLWQVEPEYRLMLAFLGIVEAHGDSGRRTVPCPDCPGACCERCGGRGGLPHPDDVSDMAAQFETVLRREEARQQGKLSVADRQREGEPVYRMSDELRGLFGQPDPMRALIGGFQDEQFVEGLARLTEAEMEAYDLHLNGLSRAAIALALVPKRRRRFGRNAALPLETISKYLWRARVKLRTVFALPLESERAYLEALDAEEAEAAERKRQVEASRVQAEEVARTGGYQPNREQAWPEPWEETEAGLYSPTVPMPEDEENPPEDQLLP